VRSADDLIALFRSLRDIEQTTYILSGERTLLRVNRAWEQFALANRGEQLVLAWPRGSSVLDAMPTPLRAFYSRGYDHTCQTGQRWEHVYECSSDRIYRSLRMIAYPFGETLVVTHALTVEEPHTRNVYPPGDAYLVDGVITMCSHCRLVKHASVNRWDWVPALVVAMPANVSHGLCPPCATLYGLG
jgi:hypothetical protein